MAVTSDTLRRYLDLFIESLDEDVSGADLARRAFLSRYHVDRVMQAALGEPPGALRRRLLLERAAWRLTHDRASATEVALDASYGSLGAFTRAFRRSFGAAPSAYRARPGLSYRLPAPNGVHFHPPGGLQLSDPRQRGSTTMDLTDRLVAHNLWLTQQLLARAAQLPDEALDRPLDLGETAVRELSEPTLRGLLDRLVFEKETWTAGIKGRALKAPAATTIDGLQRRLDAIGPEFRDLVHDIDRRGDWDRSFIDTTCDPPETFTLGGAIAHVITFSAYRRELVVGALRHLGAVDLGYADPIHWERDLTDAGA
jgi:AraC family transcriptional regulator